MLKVRLLRPLAASIAAIVLTAGCFGTGKPRPAQIDEPAFEPDASGNIAYVQRVPSTTRLVRSASYRVGEQRTAGVGEAMLGVRNYTSLRACGNGDRIAPVPAALQAAGGG